MKSINELRNEINKRKNLLLEEKGKLKIIKDQISKKEDELGVLKKEYEKKNVMKSLIEKSASEARDNGIELLEQVLTSSLQTVFGENTEAKLIKDSKDGIPTLSVSILKHVENGTISIDPTEADGGGLADVVALSSFMGLGQLIKNNYAPYVFDEPTKYVSEGEKAESSADFIENMVKFTKKQTIISTHDKALLEKKDLGYILVMDEETGITKAYEE